MTDTALITETASPQQPEGFAARLAGPTSSRLTRALGVLSLVSLALFLPLALVWSPPEAEMADAVRLFYVHVPSAIIALYFAFGLTFVGSVLYLWRDSDFWDTMAGAAAEIGVLFAAMMLITGSLWGKPTWGTYWQWDPRLTSTSVTFVLYLGYLAVRRLDLEPAVRARRAAFLGIISMFNLIIVRYSVDWWRSLHQSQTLDPRDSQIDDGHLLSFFLGLVTLTLIFSWLLVHRFRLGWMERQADDQLLDLALAERAAEARIGSSTTEGSA